MSDVSFVSQRHLHSLRLGRLIFQLSWGVITCLCLASTALDCRFLGLTAAKEKLSLIMDWEQTINFAGSNSNENQISFWTFCDI